MEKQNKTDFLNEASKYEDDHSMNEMSLNKNWNDKSKISKAYKTMDKAMGNLDNIKKAVAMVLKDFPDFDDIITMIELDQLDDSLSTVVADLEVALNEMK